MSPRRVAAVGLVPHPDRDRATDLAKRAAARLAEAKVEVRVPGPDADAAGLGHLGCALDEFARATSTSSSRSEATAPCCARWTSPMRRGSRSSG